MSDQGETNAGDSPDGIPSSISELYGQYLVRCDHEPDLDFDCFCREHPDEASSLRKLHEGFAGLREAGLPSSGLARPMPEDLPTVGTDAPLDDVLERLKVLRPGAGRYVIGGKIAEGGMGCILAARDVVLHRDLAMKVLQGAFLGNQRALARLLDEAQVTGQLEHPAIVPVHDLGLTDDGELFFMMKLVEGEDLSDVFARVNRDDRRELVRALALVLRACEAVAYAHDRGVLHRDLKPANIRVGSFGEVYVMDWGLSRVRELSTQTGGLETDRGNADDLGDGFRTMEGDALGTPCYMSPEQAKGKLDDMDARSDVYSMGAILYELLAGVPPHIHPGESPVLVDSMTLLKRAIHERPTALQTFTSSAPPELISICEKAMSPDREQRYPDVMALSEDLAAFMEDRVVKVHQTGALVELRKWVQRNRGMAATLVGSVVMLLGAAGITIYLVQEEEKRTRVALHAEEAAVVEMKAAVAETKAALVIRDGALATSKTSLAAEVVAKEEAQESADLARNRLAREWLSTGRTQGALGRWDDALKYYDDAAEKDDLGELEIELQLARSEALQAQYRRQEALEILDELESRDDLGALQSLVDLRLGALSLVGWREIDAEEDNGEALVRSALASKALTPADTAFAEALLAKETWTTRDRLLEALRIEPFHYFANSLLLPYYMLSGRRAEAVSLAKKMQQLFPSDPTPRVTLAMCYATQQNFDGAWEQFALLESTLPEEGMEQLKKSIELCEKYKFESHLGTYFGCEHRFLSGKAVNQIQTHSISNIFQGKHFRELIPQVPSMRDAMDLGLEALTDIMWGRYEKGSALLKQALKIHDDGVFRYSIATVHLLSAPATDPPRLRQILLEVIEGCKLAESTPSMLPTISAPARFMRLRCEAIVARVNFKESGSEQVYDEVLAHVKLMDTFEGAGDCSFGFMRGELLSTKAPAAIPYELSSAWLRRVPDSELAARAFIDDAQRHGLPAEALARLDNLRVMVGDEEALMLLRSELITEISLATPGATPGESPQLPDETDLAPTPSTPKDQ